MSDDYNEELSLAVLSGFRLRQQQVDIALETKALISENIWELYDEKDEQKQGEGEQK
jgi:hypothetical protein